MQVKTVLFGAVPCAAGVFWSQEICAPSLVTVQLIVPPGTAALDIPVTVEVKVITPPSVGVVAGVVT